MIGVRLRWRLFCLLMAPAFAYEAALGWLLGFEKRVGHVPTDDPD